MNDYLKGIKAIIFDLGNVIIDLHYDRTVQTLSVLSGFSKEKLGEMLVQAPVLQAFEIGAISEGEFRKRFCELLNIHLKEDAFDEMWNSFLGGIAKPRINRMLQLKSHYRTFILSNTNSIHVRSFNAQLAAVHGLETLDALVDRVYFSHEVGMRKPNEDIYTHVLQKEGLSPHQTLFIDDRTDNVQAAAGLGIRTYHNLKVDDWMELRILN